MRPVGVLLLTTIILLVSVPAQGNQFMGGKSSFHASSALVMPPGALDLSMYARGYVATLKDKAWTLTNGTSAIAGTFGFNRRTEIGFTQILYQDLNVTIRKGGTPISAMIPGDTYIRFKMGGYALGDKVFFGLMPVLRYRVALFHDVHLEPYQSKGVEAELVTLWSYFQKPFYPDEALSVHLNLGAINHNDQETISDASISINYALGVVYPKRALDLGFELYGSMFMQRPSIETLDREDWAYVAPFVRYKLFKGLNISMGLDVLVMGKENTTVIPGANLDNYPNYSEWRITGKISFNPSTAFYISPTFSKVDETGGGRERRTGMSGGGYDRQELIRWAIEERGADVEIADLDIKRIRQERIKAEEELKRLKRKLEEKQSQGK